MDYKTAFRELRSPTFITLVLVLVAVLGFAQQPGQPQQPAQTHSPDQTQTPAQVQPQDRTIPQNQSQTPSQPKPCVIVQHEGSHAFRNVMLLGVAGAVISKERYKVLESNVAGLNPGDKMHGDELTARTQGSKVVVVKKDSQQEMASARDACTK